MAALAPFALALLLLAGVAVVALPPPAAAQAPTLVDVDLTCSYAVAKVTSHGPDVTLVLCGSAA